MCWLCSGSFSYSQFVACKHKHGRFMGSLQPDFLFGAFHFASDLWYSSQISFVAQLFHLFFAALSPLSLASLISSPHFWLHSSLFSGLRLLCNELRGFVLSFLWFLVALALWVQSSSYIMWHWIFNLNQQTNMFKFYCKIKRPAWCFESGRFLNVWIKHPGVSSRVRHIWKLSGLSVSFE